jgi:hypothetical protein
VKLTICCGFDGSDVDDFSAIRAETLDGYQFTPTYEIDGERFPTIWNPTEHGGRIPRAHVHTAIEQLFADHHVLRFYCDPPDWKTEIESWALQYGEKKVLEWATYRVQPMHEALKRFVTDLQQGRITHDGCPITALHMANARKEPKPGLRYLLGKPHGAYHQKIDAAMASVLAHEAACDAVAAGETAEPADTRVILFGW